MEKEMPLDSFPSNAISHIILWNPQEHLLIHLVEEVKLVGLAQVHWMFSLKGTKKHWRSLLGK
jgi:hypothetical protein